MILIDTSVLLDLLSPSDTPHARWSKVTRSSLVREEAFGCNFVVLAELAGRAREAAGLLAVLEGMEIEIVDFSTDAAFLAGTAFREYRRRGGPRTTILADFLIGGHAAALGALLMTRDRRFVSYFPDLKFITPVDI